ncbi:MAG: peptidoglycan synthetase [Bacteroidetes bacterium]|nr:peptidoglycan synthetase [Bacteroidota bacterium]
MKIHFIAIGGSAMHGLAIELHKKGYEVTGSDDEIYEPARANLARCNLLPAETGWFPDKIHPGLNAVILGMHARADNPELKQAQNLKIPVFSYPEFIYEQSKNKKRVVVAGSHGKTTITGIILHVLRNNGIDFDYMSGAAIPGFDSNIRLTDKAPLIVLEGDEYLSSPIDRQPKFLHYKSHIALISGIAWDHINVFPDPDIYTDQFRKFVRQIPDRGTLIFCVDDPLLKEITKNSPPGVRKILYGIHPHKLENGTTFLLPGKSENRDGISPENVKLSIFGDHNLYNISGAMAVCRELGLQDDQFYRAVGSFSGAKNRLQLLAQANSSLIFRDFAHAPSKVTATLSAVKKQFPLHTIIACLELHTFSSLNVSFLSQYRHSLDDADQAFVYFNPHAVELKKLRPLDPEKIREGFGRNNLEVISDSADLKKKIASLSRSGTVLLMMTSGDFDGMDMEKLAREFVRQ